MLRDLETLIRNLRPTLRAGTYAFCTRPGDQPPANLPVLMTFREAEGLTLVVDESVALANNLSPLYQAAWIELGVESDLAAVGLLAAVTRALAAAGISCNVVSAVHHDHLFVPPDRAGEAMAVLTLLSRTGRA